MNITNGEGVKEEQAGWRFRRSRNSRINFFSYGGTHEFAWWLLIVMILMVYTPYLGSRVVRPAGDDKVYVSQAVEMARSGSWFVQTLANEPNYFKGPLHYILLRLGMLIFGNSMWATVYMNLMLLLVGAVALGRIVQRNMQEFSGWGFFAGMAFAVNAGIYAHVFASQMEVEAASLMALALFLLDRAGPGRGDLKFWIVAGLVGWLKSPLHSVFLGVTAILFWSWNREMIPRLSNVRAWLAACLGIAVCAVGYAPAFFLDRTNFVADYIYRETLDKPPNGSEWHYPVVPFFTYFLLPWTLPAIVAYIDGITRPLRRARPIRSTAGSRRVVALGLSLFVPAVLFFAWHPYRGQNYNLPVIGGLILVVTSLWASRAKTWDGIYQASLFITCVVIMAVIVGLTIVTRHFDPMPFWWNSWRLPLLWLGFFLTARGIFREGVTFHMMRPDALARRSVWLFMSLGGLMALLGEREMIDVRDRIYVAAKNREELRMSYYNLPKHPDQCCSNIWSEWGYLNFMIPYPVSGIFNQKDLESAASRGDLILVPGDDFLADMHTKLDALYPAAHWKIEPWKRWKTKGKNAQGVPAWQQAWDSRDLSVLEKNYFMVKVR